MDQIQKALNTLELAHLEGKINKETIEKARNQSDELSKGGEGSRGGKVIGHTKSGKPIYKHELESEIGALKAYHKGAKQFSAYENDKGEKHIVFNQHEKHHTGERHNKISGGSDKVNLHHHDTSHDGDEYYIHDYKVGERG